MTLLRKRFMIVVPLFSLLLTVGVFASDGISDDAFPQKNNLAQLMEKVNIGGYGFWQFGQIVNGYNYQMGVEFNKQWQNNVLIGLTLNAHPTKELAIILNPEFFLNYPFPQLKNFPKSVRPFGIAYINEARGQYSFGNLDKPFLKLSLGMFAFKYNQEVRNLGEYLFRTGTYPTYIINEFDFPKARLLGLHAAIDPVSSLHADILLISEATMFPLYDFSLAAILSYKPIKALDFGGGIDFARCFPVNGELTSPTSVSGGANAYITQTGDTAYYSFKATKLMLRSTIDIKAFFGSPEIFGSEDLKLYGEICWVGIGGYNGKEVRDSTGLLLNYPWYNDINERTPRMFGFNFPAFHVLDVLSAEFEYFPSLIPNDFRNVVNAQMPMPYFTKPLNDYDKNTYNQGFWRWSVYAKKTVVKGFSVTAAAAFDHLRTTDMDGYAREGEDLTKKGNWHWKLKFGYSF
jgi:hypothetical protein